MPERDYRSVRDYPDEYLPCRKNRRHDFQETSALKTTPSELEVVSVCTICGRRKVEWMDWQGNISSRYYGDLEGYQCDFTTAELRLEYWRRRGVTLKKDRA